MLKAYTLSHVLGGQVSLFILRYYSVWFREYKVLSWPSLGYLGTMRSYSVCCRNCKIFNVETWVKSEVFGNHVCYFDMLSFDNFFQKEKFIALTSTKWVMIFAILEQLLFINHFVLKRQCWMFLCQKNLQIKAGQNNKYYFTKTSGLTQVWFNVS